MTCEELAAERVFLLQSRDTAQSLVNSFETALMYNMWNQYLQGCTPGGSGLVVEESLKKPMSRDEFAKMLIEKPLLGKLLMVYSEES